MGRFANFLLAAGCAFLSLDVVVQASQRAASNLPSASRMAVGGPTLLPYGWYDFCRRRPDQCDVPKLPAEDVVLTQATWSELNHVNLYVNHYIVPESNFKHWGTMLDHWDYPVDGKGDCKVYALFKRKILLDDGFPRQALLMTIVYDLHGEGHAILTIATDRGDFVLDDLTNEIRPWNATGYRYLKRQSQGDPNVWLDLGGQKGRPPRLASAG